MTNDEYTTIYREAAIATRTIDGLLLIDKELDGHGFHEDGSIRRTVAALVARIKQDATPLIPGSSEIRLVVADSVIGKKQATLSEPVDAFCDEESAMRYLRERAANQDARITHGPVIAVVSIPPAVIPIVKATVVESKA